MRNLAVVTGWWENDANDPPAEAAVTENDEIIAYFVSESDAQLFVEKCRQP